MTLFPLLRRVFKAPFVTIPAIGFEAVSRMRVAPWLFSHPEASPIVQRAVWDSLMRDLIRPTFFLLVRLSLFLSLVSWAITNWRSCRIEIPGFRVEAMSDGYIVTKHESFVLRNIYVFEAYSSGWDVNDWVFGHSPEYFPVHSPFYNPGPPYRWSCLGFIRARAFRSEIVAVTHWLVVSVSVLVYAVLKWIPSPERVRAV